VLSAVADRSLSLPINIVNFVKSPFARIAEIKFVLKDNLIEFPYNGKPQRFKVTGIHIDRKEQARGNVYAIGQATVLKVLPFTPSQATIHKEILEEAGAKDSETGNQKQDASSITALAAATTTTTGDSNAYEQIGGLGAQIKTVREMVEIPLHNPEIFTQFGKRLHPLDIEGVKCTEFLEAKLTGLDFFVFYQKVFDHPRAYYSMVLQEQERH